MAGNLISALTQSTAPAAGDQVYLLNAAGADRRMLARDALGVTNAGARTPNATFTGIDVPARNVLATLPTVTLGNRTANTTPGVSSTITNPTFWAVNNLSNFLWRSCNAPQIEWGNQPPWFYVGGPLQDGFQLLTASVEFDFTGDVLEIEEIGISSSWLRISVDGQFMAVTPVAEGATDGFLYHRKLTFATYDTRRIAIELTGNYGISGIYTGPNSCIRLPARQKLKRIMFFGDSITYGTVGSGAGTPLDGYPFQVARMLAVEVINSGSGSTGYLANVPVQSKVKGRDRISTDVTPFADTLDAIVVWFGINDVNQGYSTSAIQTEAGLFVDALKLAAPKAKILLLGCYSPSYSFGLGNTGDTNREACSGAISAVATAKGCAFRDPIADLVITGSYNSTIGAASSGNAPYLIGTDGLHPTSAGYAHIARWMAWTIANAGLLQ